MANGKESDESTERGEKDIETYRTMQQQLQIIMLQKQQMHMQTDEIEHALAELDKSSGAVYRIVGPIVVQSSKEDVSKDLQTKREDMSSRSELLDKQEERLKKSLTDLRKLIEQKRR